MKSQLQRRYTLTLDTTFGRSCGSVFGGSTHQELKTPKVPLELTVA